MINIDFLKKKNREKAISLYEKNCFSKQELLIHKYEGGIIIPNEYIDPVVYDFSGDVHEDQREVVYINCVLLAWGHCITNNISRLWIDTNSLSEKTLFAYSLSNDNGVLPKYFLDILEVFGVTEDRLIKVSKPTKFKTVFLPDECFVAGDIRKEQYYTKEYLDIISKIVSKYDSDKKEIDYPDKIYLSREKIKDNKDYGEERISKVFVDMGYTVVYPEKLTFEKQLELYRNCSHFATTEGSVSHNAVFLKKGTEVILVKKADYFNSFQRVINQSIGASPIYIDAHKTISHFRLNHICNGPFFLYCSRYLSKYAGIKRKKFPVKSFLKYFFTLFLRYVRIKTIKFCVKIKHLILKNN